MNSIFGQWGRIGRSVGHMWCGGRMDMEWEEEKVRGMGMHLE